MKRRGGRNRAKAPSRSLMFWRKAFALGLVGVDKTDNVVYQDEQGNLSLVPRHSSFTVEVIDGDD